MKAWLSRSGAEVEGRDFFAEPFSEGELRALLGASPLSERFSWHSPSFRKLGLARAALSEDDLMRLMLSEPRLIRRPIVEVDGELLPPASAASKVIAALTLALA